MAAAASFYLWQPGQQPAQSGKAFVVQHAAVKTVARAFELDESEREKRRQVNASLARMASVEFQREIDEAAFQIREPKYRELFARWKMSDAAVNKALEIIKERELQKGAAFVTYLKAEDRPGSGKDMRISGQVEDTLAAQELDRLLGVNRNRELSLLDERLDNEHAARARSQDD
ncbi:hypothetical protein [Prosthecobacter sp.]|uniref:hypothetical protein n=1 Tax=Prosthecobacter sp. TaxID=1965333 RepID=UPI003783C72F